MGVPDNGCSRVLVVDDDRFVLERLRELLQGEGLEVLTAQGGQEASRLLEREAVDLALLDVMMPGESGDELCRRIRFDERTWWLPVVMVTANDQQETVRRCYVAGADGFVVKPVVAHALTATVHALREARQAPPLPAPQRKRVFLASDKPFFSFLVSHLLRAAGHEVVSPASPREARELLCGALATLDLAVLDLDFGGPVAVELYSAIEGRAEKLPLIATAGLPGSRRLPADLAALPAFDAELELEHVVRQAHRLLSSVSSLRERRAKNRVPFHSVVRYRVWGEQEWMSGYAYDLSETGMFVRSLSPLEASRPIEVSFRLQDGQPETGAKGLVIWSNPPRPRSVQTFPYGMGIAFSEFPVAEWAAVRELVARSPSAARP